MNKIIIENINKALFRQTVNEILIEVNQQEYKSRLYDYFQRLLVEGVTVDFNSPDIRHDIHGLKQKDEHFLTRL
jgi:sugar-specific transcriptional regulator TrmB